MRRFSEEYLRTTRRGMWDDSRDALADLELARRERVLDVGCGSGEFTRVIAEEVGRTGTAGEGAAVESGAGEAVASGEAVDEGAAVESGVGEAAASGDVADQEAAGVQAASREATGEAATSEPATDDGATGAGGLYAVDADVDLLAHAAEHAEVVAGDATALPFADDAVELAVCQALLINLPDPGEAVAELVRVASDAVAAVEPDNAAVTVESTVDAEADLAERARRAYRDGVATDVSLGGDATAALFEQAGLEDVQTRRYDHERTVEPPYSEADLADVRSKATGAGLGDDRTTMLAGDLSVEEFDDLQDAWRAMGRAAVEQVQRETYRRREVVPFYVTVGRLPTDE